MKNKTLIGLHIPKCAGTSLLSLVENSLDPSEYYQSTGLFSNWRYDRREFPELKSYAQLRFIWGHWTHQEMLRACRSSFLFTGIREPEERTISEYKFLKRLNNDLGHPTPSFDEWITSVNNPICHFIIERFPDLSIGESPFEKAKSALECFDYVYTIETFDFFSKMLCESLDVPYTRKHENSGDNDDYDMTVPLNCIEFDLLLYNWVRSEYKRDRISRGPLNLDLRASFESQSFQTSKLQEFLLPALVDEMKSFGVLDRFHEVCKSRMKYLTALEAEIRLRRRD